MVTINDIAKALGVAKSTVSNALTNNRYVNPELKELILKKSEELQFQPNFYATSLSKKQRTNIIGLFLELSTHPIYQNFYNELIQTVVEATSKTELNVLIYYGVSTKKVKNLLGIGKSPIDGAIILSPEVKDERYLKIEESQIPFVHIGKPSTMQDLSYVDFDTSDLMLRILTKLIEFGHHQILFINSKKDLTISIERVEAYKKTLMKHNLPFNKDLIVYSTNSNEKEGQDIIEEKYHSHLEFTAVITANDLLAYGVYEFAKHSNITIGKELSVIALGGDTYIKDALEPALSHAHQDYTKLGLMASKILMNKLEDKQENGIKKIFKSDLHFTASIKNNTLKGKNE